MNNELENIWKEEVMAYAAIWLEGLRKIINLLKTGSLRNVI
jgi:hypothetical protein